VQVGDVIAGRFELVSVAGRGGMGLVFRAHDRESGRVVALKTLAASEALEVQRFRREARVLRGLSHPGIVRYVADGSSETGAPWLAMEWVEGEDLKTRLRRGPLDIEETIELGIELCEALSTLHAMRVVHRDIKPGNVRLIENGTRPGPSARGFGDRRASHQREPRSGNARLPVARTCPWGAGG
jgi:serine/threonine protein kinase